MYINLIYSLSTAAAFERSLISNLVGISSYPVYFLPFAKALKSTEE
jgi:hypothetical protein